MLKANIRTAYGERMRMVGDEEYAYNGRRT